MTIARVTGQDNTNGGPAATSITFTYPGTPTEGNLLVARFTYRLSGTTITGVPTDWQQANTSASNGDTNAAVFWKIAGPAESTTHTWNLSASVKTSGFAAEYSSDVGWGTDPVGVSARAAGNGTGSQTSGATATSAAGATAHILCCAIFGNDSSSVTWSSITGTNVTLTQVASAASTGGGATTRTQSQHADGTRTTGNASFAATGTISATEDWGIILVTFYEYIPPAGLKIPPQAVFI
jgi:hypothetical protein